MRQINRRALDLMDSCCHFKIVISLVKFSGKNLRVPNYAAGYTDPGIASVSLVFPS